MPSTFSTSLKLELIGNGEQAGVWGTTTNNNLGTLLEQAVTGVQPITLTGGDYTLSNYNGLPDEARNAVLVLNGSLSSPCNVITPSVNKTYIVRNFSGATVTIKTSGGNGIALTNAASAVVFCDGTNFYSATTLNYINGNLVVTGTTNLQGTVTITGDLFANSNTGQFYIPVGTTGQRTGSPINGVFRYNTTLNVYEGYANGTWVNFQTYSQTSYTASYVVAAGGGGGGQNTNPNVGSAGGGAGGFLASSVTFTPGTTYYAVVGAAGASGGNSGTGGSGGNSQLTGIATAIGGGGGSGGNGVAGGSGGGSSNDCGIGGSGTSGQGNKGGDNYCRGGGNYGSTGGGGAGAQGANSGGDYVSGSAGGVGSPTTIFGGTTYLCGGGGGWGQQNYGSGGNGGGGNGNGQNGQANTGGGGGGYGGVGGSGVVVISVPTINYSGVVTGAPTVTVNGAYTVIKFTSSGTYTA